MVLRKKGFTLVELLIVISILIALMTMLVAILNPVELVNRANDAQQKKDLNRIKTAFEEYRNDKSSYPGKTMVEKLMDKSNCGSDTVFTPWLNKWPCDPQGAPYYIEVEVDAATGSFSETPKWFKIFASLKSRVDKDIPSGWYNSGMIHHLGKLTSNDINYGVSSTNVLWNDEMLDASCAQYYTPDHVDDNCYLFNSSGSCVHISSEPGTYKAVCKSGNCYAGPGCVSFCKVTCCRDTCK